MVLSDDPQQKQKQMMPTVSTKLLWRCHVNFICLKGFFGTKEASRTWLERRRNTHSELTIQSPFFMLGVNRLPRSWLVEASAFQHRITVLGESHVGQHEANQLWVCEAWSLWVKSCCFYFDPTIPEAFSKTRVWLLKICVANWSVHSRESTNMYAKWCEIFRYRLQRRAPRVRWTY